MYKQCTLKRSGNVTTVEWIPSNLAKVGQRIEFKEGKDWNGLVWTVTSVGSSTRDCTELMKKFHNSWGSLDMPRRRGK